MQKGGQTDLQLQESFSWPLDLPSPDRCESLHREAIHFYDVNFDCLHTEPKSGNGLELYGTGVHGIGGHTGHHRNCRIWSSSWKMLGVFQIISDSIGVQNSHCLVR
jgi:hypothetical protein